MSSSPRGRHASEDDQVLSGLIVRESDRLTRLLSEFLDFARVRATKSEPVDLLAVAKDAARVVQVHPDCGPQAAVVVEGEETILQGDEDLLHRVVANLLLNAVQAARGQPVRVTVRVGMLPANELPHGANFEEAARLQVVDDGPGIPDEIKERLFQPFVSGRPGGSGLGLAIVQRAVEAHRGLVYVETRLRRRYHLYHPSSRPRHGGGSRMSQKPTVLVIDDESGILDTLRILLRE